MPETDLGSRIHPNEGGAPGRGWGSHQFGLVAIFGLEAGVVAAIVVEMIHATGVLWLVASIATVLAAVIVAFALLRLTELCAWNRQVSVQARRGWKLTDEAGHLLEARHPGIGMRAAAIDADNLLDRVLRERSKLSSRD
jgi:hypothetical protein